MIIKKNSFKLKLKFVLLLFGIIFIAAACNQPSNDTNSQNTPSATYGDGILTLAGKTLSIELADTAAKQSRGLSGREGIDEDKGMLFVFQQPGRPLFWMKDMKFSIDIIWINDNKVVDITQNVPTQPGADTTELKNYQPKEETNLVLEVSDGWVARNGLKIGDIIDLKIK
jgi:uncharacterized protein